MTVLHRSKNAKPPRKARRQVWESIENLLHQHSGRCVVMIILFSIVLLAIVWVCYSIFPPTVYTSISADGLLAYLGTTIGAVASFIVAIVAVRQNFKAQEYQQESDAANRRNDIRPAFDVAIELENDIYVLSIKNCSAYLASNIYLFDVAILACLKPGETKQANFTCGDALCATFICCSDLKLRDDGLPRTVLLQCNDKDHNLWALEYRISDSGTGYYEYEYSWMA